MIKTDNLSRSFGTFKAMDSISLELKDGEIYGLLGPNGAGKTTLIRTLACLIKPTSGTATVNGHDIIKDKQAVRMNIGLLTETPQLYDGLTAKQNLEYISSFYHLPKEQTDKAIVHYLEYFGLKNEADKKVGKFSKGMKQKVALARCLIHDPPVVMLDEPTSGLDPISAKNIKNVIKDLKKDGRTILLCTHNLYDACTLCDRLSIMNHSILYTGKPEDPAALEDIYCGLLEAKNDGQ